MIGLIKVFYSIISVSYLIVSWGTKFSCIRQEAAKSFCMYTPLIVLFLAHLSHWLMVSFVIIGCPLSVLRGQRFLQRTSSSKLLVGF